MTFERRILHHGSTPTGTPVVLSLQAVEKCWFELNRQGGCGAGELILSSEFFDRGQVEIGDWVSFEYALNERWYLGRIEERTAISPSQVRLRLYGMSIQLNEVFPGGFGLAADGAKPHRFAGNQLFSHDPDRDIETFDSVGSTSELVQQLLEKYVVPVTDISHDPLMIETPQQDAVVASLKVRGEESIRSLLKELSTRSQGASWGVDEAGKFFFLRRRHQALAAFREGVNLTSLNEIRDRELFFNRILLTGDYIYDRREQSDMIARRSYRWRGNFVEPVSRAAQGERRIRIWLPWVRTQADSLAFAREFFRTYSQPSSRFFIEADAVEALPKPWAGKFAVYDQAGELLTFSHAETVRVLFDHVPRVRMELGPLDPRELWVEPPQDERWELPDQHFSAGGEVSLPPSLSIGEPPPPPPEPPQPPPPWTSSSGSPNSDISSLYSSELNSSIDSSGPISSWASSGLASSTGSSASLSSNGNSNSNSNDSSHNQSSQPPLSSSVGSSDVSGFSSDHSIVSSAGNSLTASDHSSATASSAESQSGVVSESAGNSSIISSNSGGQSAQSSEIPSSAEQSGSELVSNAASTGNSHSVNSGSSMDSNLGSAATNSQSVGGPGNSSNATNGGSTSWASGPASDGSQHSSVSGSTSWI